MPVAAHSRAPSRLQRFGHLWATCLVSLIALGTGATGQETLPRPEQPFKGQIGRTAKNSTPDFPKTIEAPQDAPNILLILTDDAGFGTSSAFGGPIPVPTMERLAQTGLRFNNFHTTALCSPTRAALITGRNHHSVQTGVWSSRLATSATTP